jgi:hypothetical protein
MPQLNWMEQFTLTMGISLLMSLEPKITNAIELKALQAALGFLQSLMNTQAVKLMGIGPLAR